MMADWNITEEVPVPVRGKSRVYPWHDMATLVDETGVAQSVLAPWTEKDGAAWDKGVRRQSTAVASARRFVAEFRPDLRVVTRTVPEERATRIWIDVRGEDD